MKIGFAGGAMEVGGSCIYLRTGSYGILMDAGIRQGEKKDPLPDFRMIQDLGGVDAILISHAHMDHIGSLPLISRAYPSAPIYMTPMTMDLTRVLLLDSLKIMAQREEEIPMYGEVEVSAMMDRIVPLHYQAEREILPEIRLTFFPAGHIAGAACLYLCTAEGSLFYSGDFTAFAQQTIDGLRLPKLRPDICIVESTYGDKLHANRQVEEDRLIRLVGDAVNQGRKVLIPSFALGRAQEVLLLLREGMRTDRISPVPVYVDGMVREICRVYRLHPTYLKGRLARSILKGNEPFYSDEIRPVAMGENREELLEKPGPAVFVASSGMLHGGPSVQYAKKIAMSPEGLIIITGYQDEEAPGRALLNLAEEAQSAAPDQPPPVLPLDGLSIPVRARVERVGLSAHADQEEILRLLSALSPREVFLVHGDPQVIPVLAGQVNGPFLRDLFLPACGETFDVSLLNPRKQLDFAPPAVMGRSAFPDPADQEDLWRFVLANDPRREWTALQLAWIWYGHPIVEDEEIRAWQDMLRESVYFDANPHRLFLFHALSPEEVAEALAPKELNQQQITDLISQRFADLSYGKSGLYPAEKRAMLSFAFPDAVSSSEFALRAEAFEAETGWRITMNAAMNHVKAQQLLASLFGDRMGKISYFEKEKRYTVSLLGEDPGDEERARQFSRETGWTLTFSSAAAKAAALKASSYAPGAVRMDQNTALDYVRRTCASESIPLTKAGIKNDQIGLYLECTFISPTLGERYAAQLTALAEDTGWRIRVNSSVQQNLILPLAAAEIGNQGLTILKGPSYMPMDNCIQARIASRDEERESAASTVIEEKTGLPCRFVL